MSLPLRLTAVAFAGFVIFLFFVVTGFPYDRLAEYIAVEVERASGLRLTIGDLGPTLHPQGPGIRARNVDIEGDRANPHVYHVDRATLRAAWSTSWLRGQPAVHAEIAGPLGVVIGTYTMGPEFGLEGVLEDIDLEAPPIREMLPNVYLTGRGGGALNVKQTLSGPQGWVRFELAEGSVAFGDFPLAIPYESIAGSMLLGDESYLTIEDLTIKGPLFSAEVEGSVESAERFADATLNITIQIQAESDLQIPLASAGVRFDKDGSARVRISGTTIQPVIH